MSLLTASVGLLGLDTSGALSSAQALQLAALGYKFAIRYLLVPDGLKPQPLTVAEAAWLRAAGFAIGLVQMFQRAANITAANGTRDGQSAAQQAAAVGYPKGAVLWCDLEGSGYPADAVLISYLNNWANAVQAAGYPAGLYNGPQAALNAAQIQALVFPHYWEAAASVPDPSRGYQVVQLFGDLGVVGTLIDVNVVTRDNRGDLPTFWGPT